MAYRYGVSRGVVFEGNVVVDGRPLVSAWGVNAPCWQFDQYTPVSPAQSVSSQKYSGYEWLKNTYVEFEAFELTIHRQPLREVKTTVSIPPERMAFAQSLWRDAGSPVESVPNFQIKVYAPNGVGLYWLPRSVVWEFDP